MATAKNAAAEAKQSAHEADVFTVQAYRSVADARGYAESAHSVVAQARADALAAGRDADAAALAAAEARQAEIILLEEEYEDNSDRFNPAEGVFPFMCYEGMGMSE